MKRRRTPVAGRIGLAIFLLISAAFFLAPIYVMLVTSLKSMPEIRQGSILALPHSPSLKALSDAWWSACSGLQCTGIRAGFWNSVLILVPSVFLSVLVSRGRIGTRGWMPRGDG